MVLVLVVWLALPVINYQRPKYGFDLGTYLGLGAVADQFVHGAAFPDIILEGIYELAIGFHSVDVAHQRIPSDKKLRA
jgi:hypothetical protein